MYHQDLGVVIWKIFWQIIQGYPDPQIIQGYPDPQIIQGYPDPQRMIL